MDPLTHSTVSEIIKNELIVDDAETRQNFLNQFADELIEFIDGMSYSYLNWQDFDHNIGEDKKKGYISALIYNSINSQIISMKLLLSGHIVAAGNLQRHVIEGVALTCLCSSKDLPVLTKFIEEKYSTTNAVRDVLRYSERLGLNRDAMEILKKTRDFYNEYSHPTQLTIAASTPFSPSEGRYLGAFFDCEKVESYTKEINGRVNLAKVFSNFIDGTRNNIEKW